jgi:predicted metal-dependent phosphoesterase TrpH
MRAKIPPLLCELHAHTTWSDGLLSLRELVDLYGIHGFDVLCVSDHVVRRDDPWRPACGEHAAFVNEENFDRYLTEIEVESERALARHGLLVLPGLEFTYNDPDPTRAAHAVAVGTHEFVSVEEGLESALMAARAQGTALIAAHPYSAKAAKGASRATARWALEWRELGKMVDRFELANRTDVFDWVARAGLPVVASGDFHRPEHLATWKTLLPCEKDEQAVVAYLRSALPAYITYLGSKLDRFLLAA